MKCLAVFFLIGSALGLPTVPVGTDNVVPVFGVIEQTSMNRLNNWFIPSRTVPGVADQVIKSSSLSTLLDNPVVLLMRDSHDANLATFFMAYDGLDGMWDTSIPKSIHETFRSSENVPIVFFPPYLPPKDLVKDLQISRYLTSKVVNFDEFSKVGIDLSRVPWVLLQPKSMLDDSARGKLKEIGSFEITEDRMKILKDDVENDNFRASLPEEDSGIHTGPFGVFNFGDFIAIPMRLLKGGYKFLVGVFNPQAASDVAMSSVTPTPVPVAVIPSP